MFFFTSFWSEKKSNLSLSFASEKYRISFRQFQMVSIFTKIFSLGFKSRLGELIWMAKTISTLPE